MSTRSRRSAGVTETALNPTMIQLYNTDRLKKELQLRNLPTNGSKQALADRLSDAVSGTYTPEPQKPQVTTPAAVKRGRKVNAAATKAKAESALDSPDEAECSSSKIIKTEASEITDQLKRMKPEVVDFTLPGFPPEKDKSPVRVKKEMEVLDLELSSSPSPEKVATPVRQAKKRKTLAESSKTVSAPISSPPVMSKQLKIPKLEIKAEVPDAVPDSIIPDKPANDGESSDDDLPLLSKLSPKAKVAPNLLQSSSHGTRSKAVQREVNLPAIIPALDNNIFSSGVESPSNSRPHSPVVSSALVKGDSDWKPPADALSVMNKIVKKPVPEKSKSKDKRLGTVDKAKPKPINKPITAAWAEKVAELRRSSVTEQSTQDLALNIKIEQDEPSKSVVVSPSIKRPIEEKKPTPMTTSGNKKNEDDLLGSILGGQSQLLNERRRKQEELDREEAAMDEKRKIMLEQMDASKHASSSAYLLPPPPPPPKRRIEKETVSVGLSLPPPPPPPKKQKSKDAMKEKHLLPPPPPPPKPVKMEIKEKEDATVAHVESTKCLTSIKVEEPEDINPTTLATPVSSDNEATAESAPLDSTEPVTEQINDRTSVSADDNDQFISNKPDLDTESALLVPMETVDLQKDVTVPSPLKEKSDPAITGSQDISASDDLSDEEYDPFESSTLTVDKLETSYVPSSIDRIKKQGESDDSDDEDSDEEDDDDMDDAGSKENGHGSGKKPDEMDIKRSAAGQDPNRADEVLDSADLLRRANAVLQSLNNPKTEINEGGPQYTQMPLTEDLEYEPEEAEKPLPEYHGEPVPSDDDDYLFQMAAGLAKPKKKREIVIEEEKLPSDETIEPDYYNADLHIKGATDKNWLIEPENADGLALMWGGVRSNYGVRLPFRDVRNAPVGDEDEEDEAIAKDENDSKVINSHILTFQIKITEYMSLKHLPFDEIDPYDIRVGFSLRYSQNIIGEHPNSYCFSALGKKASNNMFTDYGEPFGLNDVITACIDLDEGSVRFWKNDTDLGIAFQNVKLNDGDAVYPHICTKNCVVAVNFGTYPGGEADWKTNDFWRFPSSLGRGDLERSVKAPESKSECTVLMLVGLPGVGKTMWVRQYLRDHPGEQWTVIQAETILAAMRMNGVSRQRAHQGRWDMVMGLVGKVLQRNVLLAARRRRNYILDMCNTARDMRKKRLQLFEEFRRKCVVIIPSDEDMLDRQARQARSEGTGMIPPEAILEMKAMMAIPAPDQEPIEDVYFIEPPIHRIQDAIEIVAKYNEEGRPWFQKKYRRRRQGGYQPFIPEPVRKVAPVTVLPPLKISITDTPSQSSDFRRSGSFGSTPGSASSATSYSDSYRPAQQFSYDGQQEASGSPRVTSSANSGPSNESGALSAPYKSSVQQVADVSCVGKSPMSYGSGANLTPLGTAHSRIAVLQNGSVSSDVYVPQYEPSIPSQRIVDQQPSVHSLEEQYGYQQDASQPPPVSSTGCLNEDNIELSAEEMQELRDSTRYNSNQNPVVQEALLRAKMRALQVKKKEKLQAAPNFITVVSSRVVTAAESENRDGTFTSNGTSNISVDSSVTHSQLNSPVGGGNSYSYPATPSSSQQTFHQQLSVSVSSVVGSIDFSTPPPIVHGGSQQSPALSYAGFPPMNIPPPVLSHSPAFVNTSIPPPMSGSVPSNGFSQVIGSNWNSSR